MRNDNKQADEMDKALNELRKGYEQTADHEAAMPEPKEGKVLHDRRWPRILSFFMGIIALIMVAAAMFLFNLESKNTIITNIESGFETVLPVEIDPLAPTPPFITDMPIFEGEIPIPPEPTPWPTPSFAPDDSSG